MLLNLNLEKKNIFDSLFPKDAKAAVEIQRHMAQRVICEDAFGPLHLIAGMDVSCRLYDPKRRVFAACVVLSKDDRTVQETSCVTKQDAFPYIPGLLAFRESPSLIEAYEKLTLKPDLIMVDGQGICHPRGLGIASHVGVLLDIPAIGVAKTILVGEPKGELGTDAGSKVPLEYHGKMVAMLLRTKTNVRPLIISTGHKVSLDTAVSLVQQMLGGYRLPEPTRQAHIVCKKNNTR